MRATVTGREAAEYLNISYWLILEMAKRGEIPHVRAGRRVLFRTESLNRWLEERELESVKKPEAPQCGKIRRVL